MSVSDSGMKLWRKHQAAVMPDHGYNLKPCVSLRGNKAPIRPQSQHERRSGFPCLRSPKRGSHGSLCEWPLIDFWLRSAVHERTSGCSEYRMHNNYSFLILQYHVQCRIYNFLLSYRRQWKLWHAKSRRASPLPLTETLGWREFAPTLSWLRHEKKLIWVSGQRHTPAALLAPLHRTLGGPTAGLDSRV